MKVKIASCYFMTNYGSLLQTYALQQYIENQGFEVENLCIDGIKKELDLAKIKFYIREAKDFSVILNKGGRVIKAIRKKLIKSYGKALSLRAKEVTRFREEYIKISPEFDSKNALGEYVKESDAVIVGSDQLWLPSNIVADYYTLNFVPEQIKKISYATSIGISSLPHDFEERTKNFLSRFSAISVREDTGKSIVEDLGLKCELVCDPTMLLTKEDWDAVIPDSDRICEPYIFCYFLGKIPEHRELAKRIKRETGYKIVALIHCEQYSKCDYGYADITPYDVGPDDFVNLIRHASIVLTDSFHGSCFSIINQRNFFTLPRHLDDEKLSTNSRIYSLARVLGFSNRVFSLKDLEKININDNLDYSIINQNLSSLRSNSQKFLLNALMQNTSKN